MIKFSAYRPGVCRAIALALAALAVLGGVLTTSNPEDEQPDGEGLEMARPPRIYTSARLLESARAIELQKDHGVYVSGYRWTADAKPVEDPRSRDHFWYLGLIDSPEDTGPRKFEEAQVVNAVLVCMARAVGAETAEEIGARVVDFRKDLEPITSPGQPIRGSTVVLWLDVRAR